MRISLQIALAFSNKDTDKLLELYKQGYYYTDKPYIIEHLMTCGLYHSMHFEFQNDIIVKYDKSVDMVRYLLNCLIKLDENYITVDEIMVFEYTIDIYELIELVELYNKRKYAYPFAQRFCNKILYYCMSNTHESLFDGCPNIIKYKKLHDICDSVTSNNVDYGKLLTPEMLKLIDTFASDEYEEIIRQCIRINKFGFPKIAMAIMRSVFIVGKTQLTKYIDTMLLEQKDFKFIDEEIFCKNCLNYNVFDAINIHNIPMKNLINTRNKLAETFTNTGIFISVIEYIIISYIPY